MKATGVVRRTDNLGRVTLPIELRQRFDLSRGDAVEIYTDNNNIIMRRFELSCIFCGSTKGITEFKGKAVCEKCRIAMENNIV
jgi:transcriptional pleiotropic regulator of transition state genes